jgi:hypothetical protein
MMARPRRPLARSVVVPPRQRPTTTRTTRSKQSQPPRKARRLQTPTLTMPLRRRKVVAARRRPLPLPLLTTRKNLKLKSLRRRLEAILASRFQLRKRSKKSKRPRLRLRRRLGAVLASHFQLRRRSRKSKKSRLRPRRRLGAVLASQWPPTLKTNPRPQRRRALAVPRRLLSRRLPLRVPTSPPRRRAEVALASLSLLTTKSEHPSTRHYSETHA